MTKKKFHWGPLLLGVTVLAGSAAAAGALLLFKRAPAEATVEREEKPMHVEVLSVQPAEAPVTIEGFGEAASLRTVSISPEVSGRVIAVHDNLVAGGMVGTGELLFAIDPRPYEAQVADAHAQVTRQENVIARLRTEEQNAEADLKTLARQRDLAANAHERAQKLFDQGVGSRAAVDQAEQSFVTAQTDYDRLSRDRALYPIRIGEAESDLQSAQARLRLAEVDLEHTRVLAPFAGRVKAEWLEANEVATAGSQALTLVDDSILEIAVPLNSQDARRWLQFERPAAKESDRTWFDPLVRLPCTIHWTEGGPEHTWEGTLDRVAAYDESSRTLTVVVRIGTAQQRGSADGFPLVEGMFCNVSIPGRPMEGVYCLPSHAVSFENTVYLAQGDRLKTVAVSVARIEQDVTYVSDGLSPGDQVIITRLVNPLDHTPLVIDTPREGVTP